MSLFARTVLIAAAAMTATPALAADAFPSFTGANGAGGFYYGSTDKLTIAPFTSNANCVIGGSTCLNGGDILPQASVGGTYPSFTVPTNAIVLHPGNSDLASVYGAYLANTASHYSYTINLASVGNDTTDGVGYTLFTSIGGIVTLGTRAVLPTFGSSALLSGTTLLGAGESFGVIIDRNSVYYGDSTAFNFAISAVPETSTWAMMLAGFGMIGFAARRRSSVKTTVAYA